MAIFLSGSQASFVQRQSLALYFTKECRLAYGTCICWQRRQMQPFSPGSMQQRPSDGQGGSVAYRDRSWLSPRRGAACRVVGVAVPQGMPGPERRPRRSLLDGAAKQPSPDTTSRGLSQPLSLATERTGRISNWSTNGKKKIQLGTIRREVNPGGGCTAKR